MYLTYADYQNMGGTLVETTFDEYEFIAESVVNWVTFNRLKNETTYPEELSKLMYVLIDLIKARMDALKNNFVAETGEVAGGSITRQSNDGVTIEFNSLSASSIMEYTNDKKLGDMVRMYLNGLKNSLGQSLTYRGLYPGE